MKKRGLGRQAPINLGKEIYASGERAVRQGDFKNAMGLFALSAVCGSAEGKWALGWYLLYGNSGPRFPKRGFDLLLEAAKEGLLAAMHSVGVCYSNGCGVKRNKRTAFNWYLRAAKLGHPDSEYNVGLFYERGNVVARDFTKAKYWYDRAASTGDRDSLAALADLYASGRGVKQDDDTAFVLYRLAARKDLPRAQYNLGLYYIDGIGNRKMRTWGDTG